MILKKSQVLDSIFYSSIFLFPIDSFPLFPTGNVYRPISVLFLILYAVILLLSKSRAILRKHDLGVLLIGGFLILQSVFTSYFVFKKYEHLFKVFITVILAGIIVISVYDFFKRHKEQIPFDKIINILKKSFLLCITIGTIQFLAKLHLIPFSVADIFTHLFTYRTTERIQMISGEPAMMYRHLIIFLIFFVGVKNFRNRKVYIFLTIFFMFISGSTYGYFVTFIATTLYILLFKFKLLFKPLIMIGFAVMIGVFYMLYNNFLDDYTVRKIDLVVDVVVNPDKIGGYLERDGSAFQRFMNPVIGFQSVGYSYGLGTGLDTYRYVYPEYILSEHPYALGYFQVENAVLGINYITPKAVYSKIATEIGLIPFIIYMGFLTMLYFRIRFLSKSNDKKFFMELLFITIVVFGINTDSIIYVNLYFLIYLLYFLLFFNRMNSEKKT